MEGQLAHQDWNTIYVHLDKKKKKNNEQKESKKKKVPNDKTKLDYTHGEEFKTKKVNSNLSTEIRTRRNLKGMTQKELAQKINVKPAIINDYESGKAVPDPKIINKLKRILNF